MTHASFAAIFPHELSGSIFSLLSQEDRIQCIQVCQLWRQGVMYWCDKAWHTTQIRLFDMDTTIDVLHDVSPIIQDLHIDSRAEPSFDAEEIDEAVHGDTDIEERMRDQQEIPMVQEIPSLLNQLISLPFDRLESIRKWYVYVH